MMLAMTVANKAAIAVFVSDSRADESAREGVIAAMPLAVWRCHGVSGGRDGGG